MERCAECGFEYDLEDSDQVGHSIVRGATDLGDLLRQQLIREPAGKLAERTQPAVWSPLEYACHLRDVLLVQRERALQARREERPTATPMGRDERVEHDGYATQDPSAVARQLVDAAGMFAHVLDTLDHTAWERTLVYAYPEPRVRTLRWLASHTLHEVRHHLLDVRRQLA